MSGPLWRVGQEVILRIPLRKGHRDEPAVISRVGRKWVYIEKWGREEAFHIDTGSEKSEFGSPRSSIGTEQMFAERDRRTQAHERLASNMRGFSWSRNLTADQMDAISDVIEAANR